MMLSRRRFNSIARLSRYIDDNAAVILIDKEKREILVGSFKDDEALVSIIPIDDRERMRKTLLPIVESKRPLLYDDSDFLQVLQPILAEIAPYIPSGYLKAVSADLRYTYCHFNAVLMRSWDPEKLAFADSIRKSHPSLFKSYQYIRQSADKVLSLVEESQGDIVIAQPTVYLSGPISNNRDFLSDFSEAEQELRDRGFSVLNPVELAKPVTEAKGLTEEEVWKKSMDIDLRALVFEADEMALIEKDGIASKGVAIEKSIAGDFMVDVNPATSYRKRSVEEKMTEDERFRISQRGAVLARALGIIC